MSFQGFLDVASIVLGLLVGSYLNVVIFRLPRRISTVLPRSRCFRCRAAIQPWDNIPLLSYLLLLGRCRKCGAGIPWRYPLVEALTAGCFFLSQRRFDNLLDILVACAFCAAMIVLAMIDLEHYLLPDAITKPGIALGLLLQFYVFWWTSRDAVIEVSLRDAVIGVLLGAGVLAALTWGWYWWKGVHGMGFGDIKMLAMVGAFLGWQGVITTLLLASLAGSIVGVGQILRGRMGLASKLPFGVFLAIAAVVALFYGPELAASYLELTGMGSLG